MNGNFRTPSDDADDEGLDPELTKLFDAGGGAEPAPAAAGAAFVSSVMLEIQRARRLRLARQVATVTVIMVIGAFLAPYAAEGTIHATGWLAERMSATGSAFVAPIGYLCASLIAWRIARWARAY
jgi:hypothetical protein